jgi:hypothetical protein
LPVADRQALRLERLPPTPGGGQRRLVTAVEQYDAPLVRRKIARLGAADKEEGVRPVRVLLPGCQQDGLMVGERLFGRSVGQETVVPVAPQPAVEMLDPFRFRRADQRPPAALERLVEQETPVDEAALRAGFKPQPLAAWFTDSVLRRE